MSNAEALRRLAQEVIGAHEDRVFLRASILNDINQIKSETRDCQKEAVNLLRTFSSQHQEMGKLLRSELGQFMSDLNAAESSRLSTAREDGGQRQDEVTQRIAVVDVLRKDLVDKLREMAEAHQEMGKQLRTELVQFMSDLNAAESSRLSAAREDGSQRQDEITQRIAVVDVLRKDLVDKLREMAEAHQEMGKQLRTELVEFMSDLNTAESSRLSTAREDGSQRQDEITQRIAVVDVLRKDLVDKLREMAEAHQEMGKQLRTDLDQFMSSLSEAESDRKTATQAYLSEVQADIRETAAAWKELIQRIQTARTESSSVVTEAAETASSFLSDEKKNTFVEETIALSETSDGIQDHALDEDAGMNRENHRERIVTVLRNHKEGMKMIQVAELLGVENWRSLIPVMRELLDERILVKDSCLYFVNPL